MDKALQKGAVTGFVYRLMPGNIVHSGVEVYYKGQSLSPASARKPPGQGHAKHHADVEQKDGQPDGFMQHKRRKQQTEEGLQNWTAPSSPVPPSIPGSFAKRSSRKSWCRSPILPSTVCLPSKTSGTGRFSFFAAGVRTGRDLKIGCGMKASLRRKVMEFGTLDGIIGCAAAGLGVAPLPRSTVEKHVRDHLVAGHPIPDLFG